MNVYDPPSYLNNGEKGLKDSGLNGVSNPDLWDASAVHC